MNNEKQTYESMMVETFVVVNKFYFKVEGYKFCTKKAYNMCHMSYIINFITIIVKQKCR